MLLSPEGEEGWMGGTTLFHPHSISLSLFWFIFCHPRWWCCQCVYYSDFCVHCVVHLCLYCCTLCISCFLHQGVDNALLSPGQRWGWQWIAECWWGRNGGGARGYYYNNWCSANWVGESCLQHTHTHTHTHYQVCVCVCMSEPLLQRPEIVYATPWKVVK